MFTGLRVGVTTAKVLAQALRIPVVRVPSLDLRGLPAAVTRTAASSCSTIDARRDEVFCARSTGRCRAGCSGIATTTVATPAELVGELEAARRGR